MDSLMILTILLGLLPLVGVIVVVSFLARKFSNLKDQQMMGLEQGRRWLIYRSLALPALFILPFFINHFHQFPCPNPAAFAGPCYQIGGTLFTNWLGLLAILFGGLMIFSVKAAFKRGRGRNEFAKLQLYLAIAMAVISFAIYIILYQFSEGKMLRLLPESTPPSQDILNQIKAEPLGVSYSPIVVIVFCVLYIAAPLLQWLKITKDKSRITGVKKKELFQ